MAFRSTNPTQPILLNTFDTIKELLDDILSRNCEEIALDLEGENLGKNGTLSLIALMCQDEKVYVLDVLQGNGAELILSDSAFNNIIESNDILKVIHAVQNDSLQLSQNKIYLHPDSVFDPQSLHRVLMAHETGTPIKHQQPLGLVNLCEEYGIEFEEKHLKKKFKDEMSGKHKDGKKKSDTSFVRRRPLTREFLRYAAADVRYLLCLKQKMVMKLKSIQDSGASGRASVENILRSWCEIQDETLNKWKTDPKEKQALKAQKNKRDRKQLEDYMTAASSPKLSKKDRRLLSPTRGRGHPKRKASSSPRRSPRRQAEAEPMDVHVPAD